MNTSRWTALAALPVLITLGACSEDEAPAPEVPPRPVRSEVVAAGGQPRLATFSGTARADQEAAISFRVTGTVRSRPVEIGERVRGGQLLAELDARDYLIRVREAEAQLANARASLRNAESNYDRVRDLYENDNIARSELDSARAAAESAEAQVRIAQQSLANHRLQLSYTRVTAPGECAIADTLVKENENVSAGQTIVRLNCGGCAEVRVSVPETLIRTISTGAPVRVRFAALPEQRFAATVTEVGVAMSSETTAFPVIVKLGEGCEQVRPGMAADVEFTAETDAVEGVVVPVVAVGEDRDGGYVFVLEDAGDGLWRARRHAVTLGEPQSGGILVTAGLEGGERVVTAGVRRIADGQVVRLFRPQP